MMICGLLGRKLGHSYSPQIHKDLGDYSYSLFEKEPEEISDFLHHGTFRGINVTIPYKKTVIPFLNEISDTARKLGAVNTVIRKADGTLYGHNTDYYGFSYLLTKMSLPIAGQKVLVLGSGGASNTVCAVLKEQQANVVIISRSGENNYDNLSKHYDAAVIVNTTPVGMYPETGVSPIILTNFKKLIGVIDIIYNPAKTKLLLDAEKLGIRNENGLRMLVAQAKEAAEHFLDRKISDSVIEKIYNKLSIQMKNWILIGMPGSGKSTVANYLSRQTNRMIYDSDSEIINIANRTIPEIFNQDGEETFRRIETYVMSQLGKESGIILSTGGGCVTRDENLDLLKQNGILIWLQRDLNKLPIEGRPLSARQSLESMYEVRKPMYEKFSDIIIENNSTPEETVIAILRDLGVNQ